MSSSASSRPPAQTDALPTNKRALFRASKEDAWTLFARAPAVRFAVSHERAPLVRTFSAVVLDGRLCFHGGDEGEKLDMIGRMASASYEELVAQIPSYWIHPELACPASTYYRSALAEGRLERVCELERKAQILTAIMRRYQPEGGYAEITPRDPRYEKVLEKLLVAELVPERVAAKHKLGQHRTVAQIERVLEGLWQRGAPGDLQAIRLIREAHPGRPEPSFLRGPAGAQWCVAPDADDAEDVARLLEGQYWTHAFSLACMARAQLGSTAWVVARDPATRAVLASARAVSDRARFAYVLDVIVRPALRGRGLGRAVMQLLLAHPAMRRLHAIALRTRDADVFYEQLGFERAPATGIDMRFVRRIPTVASTPGEP